jgi:dynein intermediate chain 2, axonemal
MGDLQYIYQKERKEFGRQCLFSDKKFLMASIPSNHEEFNDYILRNPVSEGTQLGKQYAMSEVNTVSTTTENKGIVHNEGGWPKDVSYEDPEQTLRYRRKLEKDETFITQLPKLGEVRRKRVDNALRTAINGFSSLLLPLLPHHKANRGGDPSK